MFVKFGPMTLTQARNVSLVHASWWMNRNLWM